MSSAVPRPSSNGSHRFAQERHQDPVDDEAGAIGRDDDLLAEGRRQVPDRRLGGIGGVRPADQLDQRHDRHRTEEVHARRSAGGGWCDRLGQPGDRDRAGVGGEDRIRRRQPVELAPQRRLDVEVLEDRLDHEIGVAHPTRIVGRRDPGEGGLALLGREPALGHCPLQVPGDPIAAGLRPREVRFEELDLEPDRRVDLGDPVAHQPGAGHEDPLDRHETPSEARVASSRSAAAYGSRRWSATSASVAAVAAAWPRRAAGRGAGRRPRPRPGPRHEPGEPLRTPNRPHVPPPDGDPGRPGARARRRR